MKKNSLFTLLSIFLLILVACEKENLNEVNPKKTETSNPENVIRLKKEFSTALVNAISTRKDVRDLIKNEALKKFDNDYDVLYNFIKDEALSDGKTFREVLKNYMKEEDLKAIESKLPTLTIMVPELPENSFSAELWNTDFQKPYVAFASNKKNSISILDENGEEFILETNYIPGFPVVVVKDNERVTIKNGKSTSSNNKLSIQKGTLPFEFIDVAFDNLNSKNKEYNNQRLTKSLDRKIIEARDLGIEWPRDYIYYNLTPSNPRGPFSYAFQEYITSFRFVNGDEGFKKITDQSGDPKIIHGASTGWTDGFYEFRVDALVNGKVTRPELHPMFTAKGSDLFDVEYEKVVIKKCNPPFCFGNDVVVYVPKTITAKSFSPNVPLINRDLDSYSSTMVIKIEEYDISETIVEKQTVSSKFATNFEISGGEKMKVGFKFGASMEQTTTQEHSRTYTLGSDYLGETIVNFADKVIVGETKIPLLGTFYQTREYSTGFVAFSVEPKRVQP